MKSELLKEYKGTIPERCPETKQGEAAYTLVKGLKLFVIAFTLYLCIDMCCYALSDNEAAILIRAAFADPAWQSYLTGGVKRIINGLKCDPDLQMDMEQLIHPDYIRFTNVVWNIRLGRPAEKEEAEGMLFKRYVDAHFPFTDDNVASPIFDGLCHSAFFEQYYEEKRTALLEVIGFLISDIQNVKKAIFFIGEPNSGKSVLLRLITRLVGEENVSNVSLNGLGQRFSLYGLHNKALNASGEIPVNTLNGRALDVFKGITGGDVMELEAKGKQPFNGKINAKLLYAGNTLPAFEKTDGTAAVVERMHFIKFDRSVSGADRDIELEEKLWGERAAIVRQALDALKAFVLRNNTFIVTDDETAVIQSMLDSADPLSSFIEDRIEFGKEYQVHITDVYDAYCKYAEDNALEKFTRKEFRSLMTVKPNIVIGRGKKRLGKSSPMSYFDGIRIKAEEINFEDND